MKTITFDNSDQGLAHYYREDEIILEIQNPVMVHNVGDNVRIGGRVYIVGKTIENPETFHYEFYLIN